MSAPPIYVSARYNLWRVQSMSDKMRHCIVRLRSLFILTWNSSKRSTEATVFMLYGRVVWNKIPVLIMGVDTFWDRVSVLQVSTLHERDGYGTLGQQCLILNPKCSSIWWPAAFFQFPQLRYRIALLALRRSAWDKSICCYSPKPTWSDKGPNHE